MKYTNHIKTHRSITGLMAAVMLLLGLATGLQAQQWRLKKADNYFNRYDYEKAIASYEMLSDKDKDAQVYRNLAEAYYVMGDVAKAMAAYEKLIESGQYEPADMYRYAYLLRRSGDYEQSNVWMEKYAKQNPGDSRAARFMVNPDYYKDLQGMNADVKLNNVTVNGKYADFGPAYYKDSSVVFASARGFGRIWGGNNQRYLNLFEARMTGDMDLQNMTPFAEDLNKRYHDGPAVFNKAGDMMIVTRNIYGEKTQDNKLWLYESHLENGVWSQAKPLHFNSKDYSCGHGALSADGNTLYFVSDMPGGKGQTDLYKVTRNGDGSWGTPIRLGDAVNTEGKEMFPSISDDGKYLFFASDGLPGLGGLDVFAVKLNGQGEPEGDPVNLGAQINSPADDFALIYRSARDDGYFSSNREGGKGDDDIYGFTGLKDFKQALAEYLLAGKVYDTHTNEPLVATVTVLQDGKPYKRVEAGPDGRYQVKVKPGHEYTLAVNKEGYDAFEATVSTEGIEGNLTKDIPLNREKKQMEDVCSYKIQPLYYDLDKYFIREGDKSKLEEVIALMNKYPQIKVEVGSHTDSRASKRYNIRLSRNRTMSAIKYLTRHGISRDRLIAKWYGESQPVNGCVDGVECSEEQHQLNRRTEFKIINCEAAKATQDGE